MNATNFLFDDKELNDFNMVICSFDEQGGMQTIDNENSIEFSTLNPICSDKWHFYGGKYLGGIKANFQIGKIECQNGIGIPCVISVEEQCNIRRWLERKDGYYKFKLYQTGYEDLYFDVQLTLKCIEFNGECYGFNVSLLSDRPYALKDLDDISFTISSVNGQKTISDESSEIGYIYPDIEITLTKSGDLTIKNSMYTEYTKITDCIVGEKITIKGDILYATSNKEEDGSIEFSKRFNFIFPKICNTYSSKDNILTFSLPCSVVLTYSPTINVGI